MTPSDIAKHYCRFWTADTIADNAPHTAHQLFNSVPTGPQRELLWRAVDIIARKKGVPKFTEQEMHAWVSTYPHAIEKVADAVDAGKNRIMFWDGVARAHRAEFLAMTDIAHKHFSGVITSWS